MWKIGAAIERVISEHHLSCLSRTEVLKGVASTVRSAYTVNVLTYPIAAESEQSIYNIDIFFEVIYM
jgi:hypothetical protein